MFHKHEFLYGPDLEKEILNTFKTAYQRITIVSPYIKLHDKVKDSLGSQLKNKRLRIQILFGKNYKWTKEDIEFIKRFPNVVVKHKENIHAKIYANERLAITTTMNLLEYSFKNNYETGVLIEHDSEIASFLKRYIITWILYYAIRIPFLIILALVMPIVTLNLSWFEKDKLTEESQDYICDLFNNCDEVVFEKTTYQSHPWLKWKKGDHEPVILTDRFSDYTQIFGYCIRSGAQIDFNPSQPYSKEKYWDWMKEGGNRNQKENYCHRTGKQSNGETSINNPILYNS